jgi:hypothetical protein
MNYERFYGPHEYFCGWRCISCGEIVDEVILENRQWLKKEVVPANKKRESDLASNHTSKRNFKPQTTDLTSISTRTKMLANS